MNNKVIITAAVTGAIHTPSMSEYLPITPEQIVNDAVEAAQAGASVVHIHARCPENGRPSSDLNLMQEIISAIKQRSDVVICITTGAGLGMTLEERLSAIPRFKPELASCNAGSINFVLKQAAEKIKNPKYDWEVPYLEGTYDFVFSNTFKGIEYYVKTMQENGAKPEFEVYDVGHINNLAYFLQKGLIKAPIYLQFVMGILGGIPATVDNLTYMLKTARESIRDFKWSCAAAGRHQFKLTAAALALGGNVRVGLEDNLYLGPGVMAKSSAEQVALIKQIAYSLGFQEASPAETRAILGLKGIDKVSY